jgi:leucyl-tRNA synthetase
MVLNEIFFRKEKTGRVTYFNPVDVDLQTDDQGKRSNAVLREDNQPVEFGGVGTMSKSKNNGVDPQKLVDVYGADTAATEGLRQVLFVSSAGGVSLAG